MSANQTGGRAWGDCLPLRRDPVTGRFVAKRKKDAERVRRLRIPPTMVDACVPTKRSDLLYIGRRHVARYGDEIDEYVYSEAHKRRASKKKYARLRMTGDTLASTIRPWYTSALVDRGASESDVALAVTLALLDKCRMRTGSPRYSRRTGVSGATTLDRTNVRLSPPRIEWQGKSRVPRRCSLSDAPPGLLRALPTSVGRVRAKVLNRWLRKHAGGITSKDIRTWHANAVYVGGVRQGQSHEQAVVRAADALGHTPATSKRNYLDPRVVRHGHAFFRSSTPTHRAYMSPDESLLLGYLQGLATTPSR